MVDEVPMAGGEGKLDLVKRVNRCFKRAEEHSTEWRKEAKSDFDFVAGKQWDDEDKQLLREQLRPIITFNRVGPIIEAVAGSEINNRQEVHYLPRTVGEGDNDTGVTDVLTEAARWVRDLCDAEDEESDAFMDCTTCGMGWTETRMDYETDLDGEVRIDRVDPFEMWWDPDAKKRNLTDARWVMRIKWISKDDLKAMWPGKVDDVIETAPWDKGETTGVQGNANSPDEYADSDPNPWETNRPKDSVRVVEYQWWEREPVWRVTANGEIVEFSEKKFARLRDQFDQAGIRYLKQTRRVYRRAFVAGDTVLEDKLGPCEHDFTYKCITGKRNRNKNTWYGLVRAMRDPQKWANKFYSQLLHVINSNAKGGIIAEEDAFPNQREAEAKWARSDSIVTAKKGVLQRGAIQPKPTVPYPTGLDRLMQLAMDAHYSVTGVNLEMLGMADRNQAGVLEYQRRQAGLTILAMLFDSLRRYRKEQGRVLLYFIKEYISDGRLIRVVGQEGAKYVPLTKKDETLRYDVIVDEAATSPNQKEKTFQIMTQIIPFLMKSGVPMPPEILDYSPLPASLVAKWKKSIQEGRPSPEQVEEMKQEIQKLTQENQKLKSGAELKQAKLQSDVQMKQAKFQSNTQLDWQKFMQDVKESEAQIGLEAYRTEEELDLQERKVEGELAIRRKQANNSGE